MADTVCVSAARPTMWWLVVIAVLTARVGASDPPPLELVVIVHAGIKASVPRLADYFLKRERFWESDKPIIVFNAPHDSPLRAEFDHVVLDLSPEASARYWIDQRIRSGDSPPKELSDPTLTVKLVAKLDGAIAYVSATTELTNVVVVARIRNGKLVPP